jgi:integrase
MRRSSASSAPCRDGTDLGRRDEVIIRLGLAGVRAAEIIRLRVGDLRLHEAEPSIAWIGKKRRARRVVPGPSLVALLDTLLDRQAELLGRPLRRDEPVVGCGKPGAGRGQLAAGRPIAQTLSVQQAVGRRAVRAGLGHVASHDLRRTAAGLLHRSTGADGSHHFDLLDLQKVLGSKGRDSTHRHISRRLRSDMPFAPRPIRSAAASLAAARSRSARGSSM